jgi:hypothetical protein
MLLLSKYIGDIADRGTSDRNAVDKRQSANVKHRYDLDSWYHARDIIRSRRIKNEKLQ